MKITIESLTEKGFVGLQKYFPDTTWFKIKCNLSQTLVGRVINFQDKKVFITINKKFASDMKDKTFIAYIVQDMLKEQGINVLIDYLIEVKFNE